MLHILYEHADAQTPTFSIYKIRAGHTIVQHTLHDDLLAALEYTHKYPTYQNYLLLDESRFSFSRMDIYEHFAKPCTLHDSNTLITKKTNGVAKSHKISGELLVSYIDSIYVNGENKEFLLGEHGDIFFRLYMIFLQKYAMNVCNSTYGDICNVKNVHLLPQSFHTSLFLRNELRKDNFLLLYIMDNGCKAIHVNNGFYHNIEKINMGLHALRQMYKDNGIISYRYKPAADIDNNPLAKDLVTQTLEFYVQLLIKRMIDNDFIGTDVIIISPITKNSHFLDIFNKLYNRITNNFILPFHHSDILKKYDKKRDPEDMDTLVLINREQEIKKIINK